MKRVAPILIPQIPAPDEEREQSRAASAKSAERGRVEIVAEYQINKDRPETQPIRTWTLSENTIGLRYSYPIASTAPVTKTLFRKESDLLNESAPNNPVLWLIRNEGVDAPPPGDLPTYTLAVIGSPLPLLSVQFPLTPTQNITDLLPINGLTGGCAPEQKSVNVLGGESALVVNLWLEIVLPDLTFVRFSVTQLEYWEKADNLFNCDSPLILALHPIDDTDGYELLLMLKHASGGAPGGSAAEALRCEDWKDGNLVEKVVWFLKCS